MDNRGTKVIVPDDAIMHNEENIISPPTSEHLCINYIILHTICIHHSSILQSITKKLPDSFRIPLDEALMKSFEYEFHSADFHLMIEIVTALKIVIEYLVKELEEGGWEDYNDIKAVKFMLSRYEHLEKDDDLLYEIGVRHASPSHLHCLADLPLTATYSCLSLFFTWVDEGFYDFSTLPFPLKMHLSEEDQSAMERLPSKCNGTTFELLYELQQLSDVLKKSEQDIIDRVNKPNVSYSYTAN